MVRSGDGSGQHRPAHSAPLAGQDAGAGRRLRLIFGYTWIDKGLGMISGGYIPTPLHEVYDHIPTWVELVITVGIYALGALILTLLYKMVVSVKHEVRDAQPAF